MTSALEAAICLLALTIFRRLGLAPAVSASDVVRRLGVARSFAYERVAQLRALLECDGASAAAEPAAPRDAGAPLRIENAVLRYRLEHPGCWLSGGRTVYSDDLRAFVLVLAQGGVGEGMTQEEFAEACGIPLTTLKPWWAAQRATPPPPPPTSAAPAAQPAPAGATQPAAPGASPAASPAVGAPSAAADATAGFTLQMLRVIAEWDRWCGSFDAFVRQHLPTLGIHQGKESVSQLLHLAAARKLSRHEPPAPSNRGSTFIPPPGVQWSSDGKEVTVLVGDEPFIVTWQPMVDVGSAATVGSAMRPAEDTAGVIASFTEGVKTTSAAPAALLLDNKAPNKSAALLAALPAGTFLMHGTLGRGQSKATIEGSFGLFAQDLGSVTAVVDVASPQRIALSVADAVTRAYAAGRNRRPRRKDGKTPCELYLTADPSSEQVAAAIAKIRAIKDRIDRRDEYEAARHDPAVRATLEDAFTRFGFTEDGNVMASLATLPLAAVQAAVAIYAAKRSTGSLPAGAGLRYFAGIARHCQHERELRIFEQELVALLENEQVSVATHLQRQAAALAPLDLAPRLGAIVREILITGAPIPRVFWSRRLETEAASAAPHLRAPLRRWLCNRVHRFFRATKLARQQLVELLIRVLPPDPLPSPAAA